MPKSKAQKKEMLEIIDQHLKDSNTVVFSVFEKLPVSQDQALRNELYQAGAKHGVIKKTLLRKSLAAKAIAGLPENELVGNITVTSSLDEVAGAKILAKFAKDKEGFKIIGGLLNKVWVDANKIKELAKLPSKPELIAKTIGTIKAPLNGLANVLAGNLRGLVNALNAIKNNKN